MKLPMLVALLLLGGAVATTIATSAPAQGLSRAALRQVVGACAMSKTALGLSFPCADVQLGKPGADGYAIIRSPGFASEFLLASLAPMDGIESAGLQSDAATGFWKAAWDARLEVAAVLDRPLARTNVALAVNAEGTRTQDQFHIHIDCIRQGVARLLSANAALITDQWSKFPSRLLGQPYWARSIAGTDLSGVNVVKLMATAPPAAAAPSGWATLAVVGAKLPDGADGFYLLANWGNTSAERLLDHACRVQ